MPELNKKYFRGAGDIPSDKKNQLLTQCDNQAICQTLTQLGWEGQLAASVIVKASVDGERVAGAVFKVHGGLTKDPVTFQAAKLWDKCGADIQLQVTVPTGAEFDFSGGTLASEFSGEEGLQFSFIKGDSVIPEDRWEAEGLGNFCLRMVCHLGKTSNGPTGPHIKFTVLAFPLSAQQLAELGAATEEGSWPGIKILEGQFGLFPLAPAGLWGAPIFPLIDVSGRADTSTATPSGARLKYAISALMRVAALPTSCTNNSGLQRQCKARLRTGAGAGDKEPIIIWPTAERPSSDEGRKCNVVSPGLVRRHSGEKMTAKKRQQTTVINHNKQFSLVYRQLAQ